MEITGALKKEHRELPTFNYERSKIPWVFSEKFLCGISMGLGFWFWNLHQCVTRNFKKVSGVKSLFSKSKMKNLNQRSVFPSFSQFRPISWAPKSKVSLSLQSRNLALNFHKGNLILFRTITIRQNFQILKNTFLTLGCMV